MGFEYENIVVGSSLSALIFAYANDCPCFSRNLIRLSGLIFYLLITRRLTYRVRQKHVVVGDEMDVGTRKQVLWDRLYFLLSLKGLTPLSDLCKTIRCNEELVCLNEYSKIFEASFKMHYFGDPNASGFVRKNKLDEHSYICYDYIAFNSGGL